MKNPIKFNTVYHDFVIYWKKWHGTGAVIFLSPIDLYLMTHFSTFSEFREALFCVTLFLLAGGWASEAFQRPPTGQERQLFLVLVNEGTDMRFLAFKIILLPVLSRCTRTFFQVPDPSGPGYCPNRWWALERSVCSDERPSPVTKSGKKLQMRRYCVAHVMLIILGPTQHAINHHF